MAGRRIAWMKWSLVASLAVNLAVAGVVLGAFLKGPPPAPWPGIALWHYARELPSPYRDELGRELRARRGEWVGPREALRGQRAALAAALTADPYVPEAVAEVLNREALLTKELLDGGVTLLLDQIGRMSPEERLAYAEKLREDPRKVRHHRP
jgi:uncharacterized membrane protein